MATPEVGATLAVSLLSLQLAWAVVVYLGLECSIDWVIDQSYLGPSDQSMGF